MSDDSTIMRGNILIDGLEDRIVRHQVSAVFLFDLHADGFVDFYGNSAVLEVLI